MTPLGLCAVMVLGWTVMTASPACAQGTPFAIKPGIAVGTLMGTHPATDPAAAVKLNPDAPVVVLLNVSNPMALPYYSLWPDLSQGGTLARYSSPNWTSKNLGQVFGVALGDPDTSDFYVAATGIYGFEAVTPNYYFAKSGSTELKGAVWRLNPMGGLQNGDYELVANLPNTGSASLGQIAYNPVHRVLYVSSFTEGKIYALPAPGNTAVAYTANQTSFPLGTFPTAVVPALVALDVDGNANLPFPNFGANESVAAYGSRIWALAYSASENRLYYSVVNLDFRNYLKNNGAKKNEIRSVALDGTGKFVAGSSRLELQVPFYPTLFSNKPFSFGVSDISFSNDGQAMAIAERGELLAHLPWGQGAEFTGAHRSRIMTFTLTSASTSTTRWISTDPPGPAWGTFTGEYLVRTNSAGGVDFADGYTSSHSQADVFLWSTVNSWLNNAFLNNVLPPVNTQHIYGAQGILLSEAKTRDVAVAVNATTVVTDPPKLFLVDFDGRTDNAAKNQIGDIEVRRNKQLLPVACNCATVESHQLRRNILTAKVCTPTLNFSEIRVVQGNRILTPTSITPTPPSSGAPPYCANIRVTLTGTGTSQVHFELASEADAQTSIAQCCRSPAITVTLPDVAASEN